MKTQKKFLKNLVEWCTSQKEETEYSIPITATNLYRELTDCIAFSDTIFTNSRAKTGWIEMIEVDVKKDVLNLRLLIESFDAVLGDVIEDVSDSYAPEFADWEDMPDSQITDIEDIPY